VKVQSGKVMEGTVQGRESGPVKAKEDFKTARSVH